MNRTNAKRVHEQNTRTHTDGAREILFSSPMFERAAFPYLFNILLNFCLVFVVVVVALRGLF